MILFGVWHLVIDFNKKLINFLLEMFYFINILLSKMNNLNLFINNLYLLLVNNLFTDVELILDDNKELLSIHVHRNILASNCNYFMKLFTFNSNINQNKIVLKVDNTQVGSKVKTMF